MFIKNLIKKLTAPIMWGNLLAMVAVVVFLCVALVWWLSFYTHHGEGIEVPDFYGLTYVRAVEVGDNHGLILVANDSTYNKRLPAGSVVSQQPGAGMKVKEGRVVYVTINSLTMPRVVIPDLIDNSSYREAQAKLLALEFKLLPPKLVEGEKDWVYGIRCEGRNLATGDLVAKESTLTLVIGNGLVGEEMDLEELINEPQDSTVYDGGSHTSTPADDEIDTFLEVFE